MKRTPIKRKRRRDDDRALRAKWSAGQHLCAACWAPKLNAWPPHAIHHILGGARRIDAVTNFLPLCHRCHAAYHGERISPTSMEAEA